MQRLEEELEIHQSLSANGARHPNILYMDSWFQDDEYYYLILEICPHQVRCVACMARRAHRYVEMLTLSDWTCAPTDSSGTPSREENTNRVGGAVLCRTTN